MDFADRLQDLMTKKGVNKLQISRDLDISSGLPSAWIKGTKKPSYESIIALADYFCVTTDYLLCRTEVRPEPPAPKLSVHETRLLNAFRALEEDEQLIELGRIELLADIAQNARKKPHQGEAG